jgi:hypothetical protein
MHPPMNILVNFNEFIEKNGTLQNITFQGLWKFVVPIGPITRNFQYHHYRQESNTSKTFNISRYQVPLAPSFYLIDLKSQGQTFDRLIIDLYQPPNMCN